MAQSKPSTKKKSLAYRAYKTDKMAKKNETKEKPEVKEVSNSAQTHNLPVDGDEQPEPRIEEVIVSKPLNGGPPVVESKKLVAKKVFEPMQGVWKTVWCHE